MPRRLRLVLEYDGTGYAGFQRQEGQATVQGELERRLEIVCGHPVKTIAAGRTDAGAHALGQVVHFDTTGRIPEGRVARAVNSAGTGELVVRAAEEAAPGFHARYDAVRRTYHYYVMTEPPTPFQARYVHYEPRLLPDGVERLRAALRDLEGTHDFACFAAAGSTGGTVRSLWSASLEQRGPVLRFQFTADGFLRSMVRIVTGLLLAVGRGAAETDSAARALARGRRPERLTVVPAQGLFLARVEYGDGFPPLREGAWWPGF